MQKNFIASLLHCYIVDNVTMSDPPAGGERNNRTMSERKRTKQSDELERAFTLIELLVTVTIITLLTSIGIASYNRFNERQTVEQAAKELAVNLRLVQSNAIAGLKSEDCGEQTLIGWEANLGANNYYGRCGAVTFPSTPETLLKGNFAINPASSILFKSLIGDTDLTTDLTIIITPLGSAEPSGKVVISPGGEIKHQKE